MWRDPMDELIADLEQVAPPEKSKFGGNPEDFVEVQEWTTRLLRRAEDAYPDDVGYDDPEVQREIRNACRRRRTNGVNDAMRGTSDPASRGARDPWHVSASPVHQAGLSVPPQIHSRHRCPTQ